jgi:hypothetical protein
VKVWFQNRRTKHKREETETEQSQGLKTSGSEPGKPDKTGSAAAHHEEFEDDDDDEDIDCE